MPTFTPVLRTSKENAEGTAPIYIRISDRDGSRFVSLGKRVRPNQWDPGKGRVLGRHQDYKNLNRLIEERVETLKSAAFRAELDGPAATADELKAVYREAYVAPKAPGPKADGEAADYFAFADAVVDELERRGQIRTHNRYKSVTKKFRGFAGEPLAFGDLTPRLLRDYETHLIEHYGNSPNTVASNFRAIRAVLYRAIREGLADQGANPFFHFKIKRVRTDRTKLSYDQVEAIRALDLPAGSLIARVRDYFLFAFYCAGIRFGDFAELRGTDFVVRSEVAVQDGVEVEKGRVWLSYVMGKTRQTRALRRTIRLPRAAEAIFMVYSEVGADEFAFPPLRGSDVSTPRRRVNAISRQNALVNKYLKKIAVLAKVPEKLSFHISRHSFADYARREGWGLYDITKMLGHASLKTTEVYLASLDGAPDRDADELFDKQNHDRDQHELAAPSNPTPRLQHLGE